MANVSITSISTAGGTTTLHGISVSGTTVVVKNGATVLGQIMAGNNNSWQIPFPSAGNTTVTVHGGGRDVTVNVATGAVNYSAETVNLVVQNADNAG